MLHFSYVTVCTLYPSETWKEKSINADLFGSNCDIIPFSNSNDKPLPYKKYLYLKYN
jgi:hypothetical protein